LSVGGVPPRNAENFRALVSPDEENPRSMRRSTSTLLALLPLAAALTPSGRMSPTGNAATRRAVLGTAATASAALLPVAVLPDRAVAAGQSDSNEIGFSGALRSDIGPTIRGDGVEVIITEQSYKELSSCPKDFFVPTKQGPWRCLEISVTALNNVRPPSNQLGPGPRASC